MFICYIGSFHRRQDNTILKGKIILCAYYSTHFILVCWILDIGLNFLRPKITLKFLTIGSIYIPQCIYSNYKQISKIFWGLGLDPLTTLLILSVIRIRDRLRIRDHQYVLFFEKKTLCQNKN